MEEKYKIIRYVIKKGNRYLVRSNWNRDKNINEWSYDINDSMVFSRYIDMPDIEMKRRNINDAKEVKVRISRIKDL